MQTPTQGVPGFFLLALLITVLFLAPDHASAAFPGTNGKIVFTSNRDGNFEIYAINSDGSGIQRLTDNSVDDTEPAWNPAGTRIAFSRIQPPSHTGAIFRMDANGSNQVNLSNNGNVDDRYPAWSPDGTKIAFQSNRNGTYGIYTMNSDGSNVAQLATAPESQNQQPAWSPDGTKIAFVSFRDGNNEIYVMDADGSNQVNRTNTPTINELEPDWSPDGSKITFYQYLAAGGGEIRMYVMNADGSNTQPLIPQNIGHPNISPAWSPDGIKVAFSSQRGIHIVDAAGGTAFNLTNDGIATEDHLPDWQPITSPLPPEPAVYVPTQPIFGQYLCDAGSLDKKNLVFITHGWLGNAQDWVLQMEQQVTQQLQLHNKSDWAVCTYDWHENAGGAPGDAFNEARIQGQVLGQLLALNSYDSIHFIGHSAGSNLIQTAAEYLKPRSPQTHIHLTFLDAYDPDAASVPSGGGRHYGLDPRNKSGQGPVHTDWWAEQYVDMRNDIQIGLLDETNIILPDAYNFDVSALDPQYDPTIPEQIDPSGLLYARRVHGWPPDWYLTTIGNSSTYGFPLSKESGTNPFPLQFLSGGCKELHMQGITVDCSTGSKPKLYSPQYAASVNIPSTAIQQSETGTVTYPNETSAIESTGSPVWFSLQVTAEQNTNILQFGYEFLSAEGSEGILSVFVDDTLVYKIDERITPPGLNVANDISVGNLDPGPHTVMFRLDPFTEAQSVVKISDVQIGSLIAEEIVDTLPPVTSATTSNALWKNAYVGTTTVAFTAQDNQGGVGVEKTEYSFDGQIWNEYLQTFNVGTEGTTTILYRSNDFFGNMEDTKTLTLKIVGVKWFLDDALAQLKNIATGNRDIDKATDAVEKDLAKIVADKSWLDRNRLSFPKGLPVLISEVGVVRTLGDILNKAAQKKSNVPASAQAQYRDVQREIVQSSALLAKLSFDKAKVIKAKNATGQKALDKAIARIQKMLDRAGAKETKRPEQAAQLYGAAWFASEALLKASSATLFRATDFGALYDNEDMRDLMD